MSADERPAEQGGAFAVLLSGAGGIPGYRFAPFPLEGEGDFSSHVSTEGEARAMAARLTAAMAASLSQGTATVCRVMTEAAFEARLAAERARVRAEAEGELTRVTCERNAFETRLSAFRMVAEHARQVRDGGYGRAHAECAVDAMAKCLDDDEALAASVEGSDLRPAPGESSEDFVRRITKGRTMVRLRRHLEPLLRACGVGVASLSHLWLPNQIAFTLCLRLPPDGALHTVRCLVARDPKRGEGSPDEEDLFGERVATEIAWRIVVYLVSRPRLLRAGTDAEGRWREEGTTGAKEGG